MYQRREAIHNSVPTVKLRLSGQSFFRGVINGGSYRFVHSSYRQFMPMSTNVHTYF
jgi:hypothetical protein